jgi:photosystem I subunit 10
MLAPLLAIAPASVAWSPKVGLVMIVANVIAIGIGKATIKYPNEGAQLPNPTMFGGMSHASLLATTSFGHVLGMGAILGLAARGLI